MTKLLWVVESANSRFKHWKFLSNVVTNTQLPFFGDYVEIVAALTNASRPPLVSDQTQDKQLGQQMLLMKSKQNPVMEKVSNIKITQKENWVKLDAEASNVKIDFCPIRTILNT